MKIIYKQGDLLKCPESVIVHGCNAQGVMGSGVALQIKEQFPLAYDVYMMAHEAGELKLGQCSFAEQNGKMIINAVTQEFYGRVEGVRYVDYEAVRKAMYDINWWAGEMAKIVPHPEDTYLAIAMPKIGAGLANGDWLIIEKIIEEESTSFQPVVYEQNEWKR